MLRKITWKSHCTPAFFTFNSKFVRFGTTKHDVKTLTLKTSHAPWRNKWSCWQYFARSDNLQNIINKSQFFEFVGVNLFFSNPDTKLRANHTTLHVKFPFFERKIRSTTVFDLKKQSETNDYKSVWPTSRHQID